MSTVTCAAAHRPTIVIELFFRRSSITLIRIPFWPVAVKFSDPISEGAPTRCAVECAAAVARHERERRFIQRPRWLAIRAGHLDAPSPIALASPAPPGSAEGFEDWAIRRAPSDRALLGRSPPQQRADRWIGQSRQRGSQWFANLSCVA